MVSPYNFRAFRAVCVFKTFASSAGEDVYKRQVNKSRNKVALKEIKSNDIQKIKVPKKDTYSIYIQNNSGKKITVSGVIIIL